MKEKSLLLIAILISLSLAIPSILAARSIIVITPQWPIAQNTPAPLQIRVNEPADPTYDPHILLAITIACYDGLTGVEIEFDAGGSVSFSKGDFALLPNLPGPDKIPDASESDVQYTRSSLSDHLGESGDSSVYCAMKPIPPTSLPPDGQLHTTPQTFTVTLYSTNPKMLVYAIGKSSDALDAKFDRWVPPTNPGFVVPEPATIVATATSLLALVVYAVRRRKH